MRQYIPALAVRVWAMIMLLVLVEGCAGKSLTLSPLPTYFESTPSVSSAQHALPSSTFVPLPSPNRP